MIEISTGKSSTADWIWKTVFRSKTVKFDTGLSEETVFSKLDQVLDEIFEKQKSLLEKLGMEG